MPLVFISYRRKHTLEVARNICQRLIRHYGSEEAIFLDEHSIPKGCDLREYIRDELSQCEVFLPLIDYHWVNSFTRSDTQFSNIGTWEHPNDWVGLEVQEALECEGLSVLPLLIDIEMPSRETLLPKFQAIRNKNAIFYWSQKESLDEFMPFLIKKLDIIIQGSMMPLPQKNDSKRSKYYHEARHCYISNNGQLPKASDIYLSKIAEHLRLTDSENHAQIKQVQADARHSYDLYVEAVQGMIQSGFTEPRGNQHQLKAEAKRLLRRLAKILDLPKWKALQIEAVELRNRQ
jgi:hypothetical protein